MTVELIHLSKGRHYKFAEDLVSIFNMNGGSDE